MCGYIYKCRATFINVRLEQMRDNIYKCWAAFINVRLWNKCEATFINVRLHLQMLGYIYKCETVDTFETDGTPYSTVY